MKHRNPFVSIVIIIFIIIFIMCTIPIFAQSTMPTNTKLARNYCKKHYPKQTIKFVNKYNPKIMENRKGKNVVYIEKFISYSKGRYGYSKKGEYVAYNKYVKNGKKVISYFIYNPNTNYFDDVVAVIDCGKIR